MSDDAAISALIAALGLVFCTVGKRMDPEQQEAIMSEFKRCESEIVVQCQISSRDGLTITCFAHRPGGPSEKLFEYSDADSAKVFQSNPHSVN